ncbi:hypothetical protein T484DRAFT_2976809 [Baffinella frigidus]|nr:hypothetical protein T484DRAFT_2976809 [Cryptophyta sp. CCMP2293]
MPDGQLGPAVSRVSNVGTDGATVNHQGDAFLLAQLAYSQVGETGQGLAAAGKLWLDESERTHYTPPAWEPLFLGGIGFVSPV